MKLETKWRIREIVLNALYFSLCVSLAYLAKFLIM